MASTNTKVNRSVSSKQRIVSNVHQQKSNNNAKNIQKTNLYNTKTNQNVTKDGAMMCTLLKQARKSGILNLSNRNLEEVPVSVWRINIDTPEEGKSLALDANTDDRWWEQTDLVKLILASNLLSTISEDISLLPALTVLDLHDNKLTSLPDSLVTLGELVKLNISQNLFEELPKCVYQMKKLCLLMAQQNNIRTVSDSIGYLVNLEELDLSGNELTEISPAISYLTKLNKLNISKNKLLSLPNEIDTLNRLNILDLSQNQLPKIPDSIGRLKKLEILYLRFNKIEQFPNLEDCTMLKELYLGKNNIKNIPAHLLSPLVSLVTLDLKDNQLDLLPDDVCSLERLERLDLSNNNLSNIPSELGLMVGLKVLFLEGNPMRCIRRDIIARGTVELKKFLKSRITNEDSSSSSPQPQSSSSTSSSSTKSNVNKNATSNGDDNDGNLFDEYMVMSTKILNISNKKLMEIPENCILNAVKFGVTQLDASKNIFSVFPSGIKSLNQSLCELDLSFNKLTTLDCDVIGSLTRLVYLNLSNNQLSILPNELTNLSNLREINLNMNKFTTFPDCLYRMKSIEIIMLSDNKIEKLRVEDGGLLSMPKLSVLDLQNNNINNVPPTLGNCTQLRSLRLEGNCFRNPNASTLAKGTAALLEYLRNRIPI